LFCKSYGKELHRAKRLADSVDIYNTDNIKFYVSVPQEDIEVFRKLLKNNKCFLLTDEEIIAETCEVFGQIPGYFSRHLLQQLIKLEFWRMEKSENYAWVDSDSYFIKEFKISDFMYDDKTPYTIMREFDLSAIQNSWNNIPKKLKERRINDRVEHIKKFKTVFGEGFNDYVFGDSTPIIWSSNVLKDLYENYLIPEKKTIFRLLSDFPCETYLYGYYLIHSNCIPVYPKQHMFKAFDYLDEFIVSEMMGGNECSIAKEYFGICIQSNWALFEEKKSILTRLKNRKQEFMKFLLKISG